MVSSLLKRTAFALMLLALPFNGLLAEQELRLTPTDDVYIYSNGDIRGMEEWLRTYHSTNGSQYRRITYIKFDVSQVPTEVDSVVLRLYTNGWNAGGDNAHQFNVYPVDINTWAEDDVTFVNYKEKVGEANDNLLASYVVAAGAAQPAAWLEWRSSNLTNYVKDSAVAAKDLLSFRIREGKVVKNNSGGVVVDFHSKENQSGFAPELVVYSPDGAKPADREPVIVVHDSAEARLSTILLDGEPLEFFNKDQFSYTVNLTYSATGEPVVTATALDTVAKVVVNDKTITCTSADGQHQQTYTVAFQVLPKMDLFLAIGQSNMSGRAPYDDAKEPMEGIYLLTPQNGMEISSNPMNKYSNIRKDLSVQRMSPAYQFALSIRDSLAAFGTPRTIGMVVNAQGGSSISLWYQPGKSLYDATMRRCKEAAKWGEWKGVIWHQGGADNSQGEKDKFVTYRSQMKKLAENLRQDLGVDTLWFICGELSQRGDHDMFNDTVIRNVQNYIDYADYVVSEGTSLLSDNTHFDEPSVKLMGLRYAQKILQHVYTRSDSTTDDETQLADTVYKASFVADGVAIDGASTGTPAVTYTYTKQIYAGDNPTAPNMSAEGLKLNNKQAKDSKGINMVTASPAGFAAPFATKLSEIKADSVVWTFNYRDNNGNNSGAILEGKNGYAIVLAGNNSDLLQGSGYAVMRGSSAGDSKLHLVKYDGGIYNNRTTDIVATDGLTKKAYFTVRVVFEPKTSNWKLYVLETSGAYTIPEKAVFTTCLSATDNTYVGEEMKVFGFAGSYSGNVSSQMWVKNYAVIVYPPENLSPTTLQHTHGTKVATKIIRNGQLYIVRDGKAVNVLGF